MLSDVCGVFCNYELEGSAGFFCLPLCFEYEKQAAIYVYLAMSYNYTHLIACYKPLYVERSSSSSSQHVIGKPSGPEFLYSDTSLFDSFDPINSLLCSVFLDVSPGFVMS